MSYRPVIFLSISVLVAVSLLGGLLLVATSPIPDRLLQAQQEVRYLNTALTTVEQAVQARIETGQLPEFNTELDRLDSALANGNTALQASVHAAFQPIAWTDRTRIQVAHAINWQDTHLAPPSDVHTVVAASAQLGEDLENISELLVSYRERLHEYVALHETFVKLTQPFAGRLAPSWRRCFCRRHLCNRE